MNSEDFNKVVEDQIDLTKSLLISKNTEYTSSDDRLSNFKELAQADGVTPMDVLWGLYLKHWGSVRKMVKDYQSGKVPTKELLDEKITDSVNYHILLKGLFLEQIKNKEENVKN